eukprot:3849153-Prymnesium_polylepis.1
MAAVAAVVGTPSENLSHEHYWGMDPVARRRNGAPMPTTLHCAAAQTCPSGGHASRQSLL